MADISDVWKSMKMDENEKVVEYKKRIASTTRHEEESIQTLIRKQEKAQSRAKVKSSSDSSAPKKPGKPVKEKATGTSKSEAKESADQSKASEEQKSAVDIIAQVSRLVEALKDEDKLTRRTSLVQLHKLLFAKRVLSSAEYSMLFRDHCRAIFKLFADPVEKCREMSTLIALGFVETATDFVSVLGYLMPCVMQRIPSGLAYDEDMKVFVTDLEAHEAYRRGRAVDRQDRTSVIGAASHTVIESSEEIRFIMAQLVYTLVKRCFEVGGAMILSPYFHEIILYFQHQLGDPFHDLKLLACSTLELLTQVPEYESGMKFFAVGLVRAILPVLRHRHAKTRLAAVSALKCCMCVPDRAKMKGSGTEAMQDLVGFREENVLQVAAFYKVEIQINYLAELVSDVSIAVREEVAKMLTMFMTEMGDRYDHQTRLLPYLLDLAIDSAPSVSVIAMNCLKLCGRQYEEDHPDEIIERRQYGVDGDTRINLDKPLPHPFTERPRIGMRLYIRGNTKRFLNALVGELTNWQAHTRVKSVALLKVVVIACEEHLTIEAHSLIPSLITALNYSKNDGDKELQTALYELLELFGRYVLPDTYVHFILPRLRGDRDVVQFGVDATTRESVLDVLRCLCAGSRLSQVVPYFESIIETICDPFVIDPDSHKLKLATMQLLLEQLSSMRGKGKSLVEAHFMNTGRLSSLKTTIQRLLRFFLTNLGDSSLNVLVNKCIAALAELDCDLVDTPLASLKKMFQVHGAKLLTELLIDYDADEGWSADYPDRKLLQSLLHCPFLFTFVVAEQYGGLLRLLLRIARVTASSVDINHDSLVTISVEVCRLFRCLRHGDRPVEDIITDEYRHLLAGLTEAVTSQSTDNNEYFAAVNILNIRKSLEGNESNAVLADAVRFFVLSNIWTYSKHTLYCRLQLVQALLSTTGDGCEPLLTVGCAASQDLSVAGCLCVSVRNAVLPTNHVSVRKKSAQLMLLVLQLLNISEVDDVLRLESYFAYKQNAEKYTKRLNSFQRKCFVDRENLGQCIELSIELLNDSNDEVRELAMEILSAAVLAQLIPEDNDDTSSTAIRFSTVVSKLLNQLNQSIGSIRVLNSLDCALRNLAVLSPLRFEEIVRGELANLIEQSKDYTHLVSPDSTSVTEFVSALVEHCQLLNQWK